MVGRTYRLVQSKTAEADLIAIRAYTVKEHGVAAGRAYFRLLRQAFKDIQDDPHRPGSKGRPGGLP